ncbi:MULTISPECIES: uracil-DNA glycosylase family protein [unclassified Spongiibacter]|jgi:uracil-DNA glycosylase|uniref:uracil-DNA glycosylase family protein n=1 Tax=unclassified Spongiibacter TaxID=2631504 RepID=UPI000C0AE85E|nr:MULTISPECIES: uracil-DNA glycosylase family protein [unclassified Spongiibacter]MAK42998.1 IclR family transcriptional regulator [Spongiibacter sp.]MEE2652252.1 uracil-DNA glycosylase family protein [Pseudomonadota bacterium]|tara:strand:- start:12523 stop:13107 length:585 start_codon:yes stop_codon:yes gene_type:complete
MENLQQLLNEVAACRLCESALPLGPRPVLRVAPEARILIIGQAPGLKVHNSGLPWDDPSGDRLRGWLNIDREQFYRDARLGILPMGFCYPGKGKSGDLPPRPECAPTWHERLLQQMPQIEVVLLIGQYAQKRYAGDDEKNLTERVRNQSLDGRFISLPHPSPRNIRWFKQNPWFDEQLLPSFQRRIHPLLSESS